VREVKKLLLIMLAAVFVGSTAYAGLVDLGGGTFTMNLNDLDDVYITYTSGGTVDQLTTLGDLTDLDQDYSARFGNGQTSDSFVQASIGFDFWTAPTIGTMGYGDLSGFDEFILGLSNDNTDEFIMVNLWLNTGWTDQPWGEPNNRYDNGWTWIAPGTTGYLSVDLSSAVNLNHASSIGFQVGTNVNTPTEGDGTVPDGWGSNDQYWIGPGETLYFNAVPEPMSMVMLGCLGAGMLGARRLTRKKK
jgi:hypothetical protein